MWKCRLPTLCIYVCVQQQLLTFGRVVEALQPDVALCCSLPLWPCCCYAVLCGQGDDGHLIKRALEGVEQPAQHQPAHKTPS